MRAWQAAPVRVERTPSVRTERGDSAHCAACGAISPREATTGFSREDLRGLGKSRCLRLGRPLLAAGAWLLALAVLAGLSLGSAPAQAAFPGQNGKIAFVSFRDGNPEIYSMNPDGSEVTRLTNAAGHPDIPFSGLDFWPAFSPDGKKIIFSSDRDGNLELYTMNPDGSAQTRLTDSPTGELDPVFSPDGSRIAFVGDRDGNYEIYTMNADGSGLTNLTATARDDTEPAWSPDGSRIVFQSNRDGNDEIYIMNANGSGQTRLTNNPAGEWHPAFSPDGRKIAFDNFHEQPSEIYTMNVDGSGLTQLTNAPGGDGLAAFSPDGTKIAFTGREDIYTMNPDGSGQVRLTDHPAPDIQADWQPIPRPASVGAPAHPQARDSRAPAVRASRACSSRTLRARVRVDEPVRSVVVSLNGRRVLRTARASFTVRVPARRLRRGRNRLTVVATDRAGNRSVRTLRFRACAAQRPRFTG